MIIGGQRVEQLVMTKPNTGRLTTADDHQEVIAIISDDNEWVVKNGFDIKMILAHGD